MGGFLWWWEMGLMWMTVRHLPAENTLLPSFPPYFMFYSGGGKRVCQHFKEECFRRIRLGSYGTYHTHFHLTPEPNTSPPHLRHHTDLHKPTIPLHRRRTAQRARTHVVAASLLYQANASAWEIVTCLRLVFGRTLRVLTRMRDTWFGLGAGLSALPRGVCSHVVICSIEVQ